jgi:drug/metabolite transporter (DMT)-like permease
MGEIASLMTAVFWAFTSILFSEAGKRVGSLVLNRVRLVIASLFLMITHLVLQGQLFPIQVSPDRLFWLSLSGVIGLSLGDFFLFQSYILIGPRKTTLLMALTPVFSTILAWVILGERLNLVEIMGISLTISAIAWVVVEKRYLNNSEPMKINWVGIAYGMGAVICQAVGLILSKKGLDGNYPAISGVLIRILAAAVAIWLFTILKKEVGLTRIVFQKRDAFLYSFVGSVVGPYLGVWFSLIAVQLIPVGIASTLMSLTPIFVLPLSYMIYKESVSIRMVLGTVGAFIGVAILSLIV